MPAASLAVLLILVVVALVVARSLAFTVKTQRAAVVERLGRFNRVARPGLNFKMPWEHAFMLNLTTLSLQATMETKTRDNVFVELPVTVQYHILETDEAIRDAYYKLANPQAQIESYIYNILLAHIPETDLDDVFLQQPAISARASRELAENMLPFGYGIVKVLITDIIPNPEVKAAMNRINAETRNAAANKAQGDAEYILKVRQAEADAEVKRLEGVGIAQEREAIAKGYAEAIQQIQGETDITYNAAAFLLLFTNWTDMMRAVGSTKNSTMVFMPSGPDALENFQQTMTNALLANQQQQRTE